MRLDLIPVHQWTHRQFIGRDPWAGGQMVTWEVAVYTLVAQSFLASTPVAVQSVPWDSNAIPQQLAVGIYNRQNGRYRILPLALQDLFRAGKVQDRDLPDLLHDVEGPLWLSDYPPTRWALMLLLYAGLVGACAVAMLLAGMVWFAAVLAGLALSCGAGYLRVQQRRRSFANLWTERLSTRSGLATPTPPGAAFPGRAAGR